MAGPVREVAPGVTRVGLLREPLNPAGIGQWAALQVAAEPSGIELSPVPIRTADEIERGIAAFAREARGGLIAAVGANTVIHRQTIIDGAARFKLPAVYPYRHFAVDGGLIAYGVNLAAQYKRAAGYVDRILKGEKPGRPAGAEASKVRAHDQSQDREGAGRDAAADLARPRRRGDRVATGAAPVRSVSAENGPRTRRTRTARGSTRPPR